MTLTKEQFSKLVENYASFIIEGMDLETLESMAFDLLVREYETYTEDEIGGEIEELYDQEILDNLMENVAAWKACTSLICSLIVLIMAYSKLGQKY